MIYVFRYKNEVYEFLYGQPRQELKVKRNLNVVIENPKKWIALSSSPHTYSGKLQNYKTECTNLVAARHRLLKKVLFLVIIKT